MYRRIFLAITLGLLVVIGVLMTLTARAAPLNTNVSGTITTDTT